MITDITGTVLTPGSNGRDCLGNGERIGVECCCNECDYLICCLPTHDFRECLICRDKACPRSAYHIE